MVFMKVNGGQTCNPGWEINAAFHHDYKIVITLN